MLRLVIGVLAIACACQTAQADVFSDDLGKCLVNATTVQDRTTMMRWMFGVASTNPGVRDLTKVSDQQRAQFANDMATLTNRLILSDCRPQVLAALRSNGSSAFGSGFQMLGNVAGRELLAGPDASAEAGKFAKFLDADQLKALQKEAEEPLAAPRASGK